MKNRSRSSLKREEEVAEKSKKSWLPKKRTYKALGTSMNQF